MASVAQLLQQKAALEKQIADAQREEKAGAIAQVKSLMAQHGLSAADLAARTPTAAAKVKGPSKVAIKFRNAETGETWTGRGLKPKWLKAQLDAGKKISDFAV